ncbi:MAG: NTP transferase domain-containing protein, partial [Thermoleophilia bacterium]|nr:NTP transferase domain-containing protein [Thermoleophilia bacterium]
LLPVGREPLHDRWPEAGPLGGIATALDAFPGEAILVVPVDMPLLGAEYLRLLLSAGGAEVACLRADSELSPLPSLWMPSCRDVVVGEVEARRLAVRAMLDQLRVEVVDVPAEALWNVNDADDYRELPRRWMS